VAAGKAGWFALAEPLAFCAGEDMTLKHTNPMISLEIFINGKNERRGIAENPVGWGWNLPASRESMSAAALNPFAFYWSYPTLKNHPNYFRFKDAVFLRLTGRLFKNYF
jgi:hypothetical protein